jgi:ABC-type anion transport system duplicated permease subunit
MHALSQAIQLSEAQSCNDAAAARREEEARVARVMELTASQVHMVAYVCMFARASACVRACIQHGLWIRVHLIVRLLLSAALNYERVSLALIVRNEAIYSSAISNAYIPCIY